MKLKIFKYNDLILSNFRHHEARGEYETDVANFQICVWSCGVCIFIHRLLSEQIYKMRYNLI